MAKKVACIGDGSSHGGVLSTSNNDGKYKVAGSTVCVEGAMHQCPIIGHGTTPVSAVTVKSYYNGKLILTEGAVAGCGAIISPPDRKHNVE